MANEGRTAQNVKLKNKTLSLQRGRFVAAGAAKEELKMKANPPSPSSTRPWGIYVQKEKEN
jgi:hypothetical protein